MSCHPINGGMYITIHIKIVHLIDHLTLTYHRVLQFLKQTYNLK